MVGGKRVPRRALAGTAMLITALAAVGAMPALGPGVAAAAVPAGAGYSEAYFESADGTNLHADVLRPKGLPAGSRTPVILIDTPYNPHGQIDNPYNGQVDIGGPASQPPSHPMVEFLASRQVFERGYSVVIVDVRGFGDRKSVV